MTEDSEKRGDTSKTFDKVRDTVPGGNPKFMDYSDEQLEARRQHLINSRETPDLELHLTIGGTDEKETHEAVAKDREDHIVEIQIEQLHRIQVELDRSREKERDGHDHER